MPRTVKQIIAEIRRQVDWRGPTGKAQGHVVIERADAITLLESREPLPSANGGPSFGGR